MSDMHFDPAAIATIREARAKELIAARLALRDLNAAVVADHDTWLAAMADMTPAQSEALYTLLNAIKP
jgi:hypothetical protein